MAKTRGNRKQTQGTPMVIESSPEAKKKAQSRRRREEERWVRRSEERWVRRPGPVEPRQMTEEERARHFRDD